MSEESLQVRMTIGSTELTPTQVRTVKDALDTYAMILADSSIKGTGNELTEFYLGRINEVLTAIFAESQRKLVEDQNKLMQTTLEFDHREHLGGEG